MATDAGPAMPPGGSQGFVVMPHRPGRAHCPCLWCQAGGRLQLAHAMPDEASDQLRQDAAAAQPCGYRVVLAAIDHPQRLTRDRRW